MRRVAYNVILIFCLFSISFLQGMEDEIDCYDSVSTVTLEVLRQLTLPQNITSLCFNSKTMTLGYAYHQSDKKNEMQFIAMKSLKRINSCKVSKQIVYSCFNDSSTQVGMIAEDGSIYVGNWKKKRLIKRVQHDNSFISLAFTRHNCFAVTRKGALFRSDKKEYKPVLSLPINSNSFPCSVIALSSCEQNNNVALVGQFSDDKGLMGFMDVITVNKDTIGHVKEYAESPITKSFFYNDGSLIALVVGKKVVVINLKNKREWTKYFDYISNVAEVCFDATGESLFVGLVDGSLYHSQLENASTRENPENYSEFLYYLGSPTKLLSYVKEKQLLCAATLYDVTLFNVVLNAVADDEFEEY